MDDTKVSHESSDPISTHHDRCVESFTSLITSAVNPVRDFGDQVSSSQLSNDFDRYKVWAGNVGARHRGSRYYVSLDYRLSEASFYRQQVKNLLASLERNGRCTPAEQESEIRELDQSRTPSPSTEDAEDSPWEISDSGSESGSKSSGSSISNENRQLSQLSSTLQTREQDQPLNGRSMKPASEISHLIGQIRFIVTCLYRLPLRSPAPMDRFVDHSLLDISIYQHFDILYVKDKFPDADAALSTRLGKLVSRRRQLLVARSARDRHLLTEDTDEKKPGEKQSDSASKPDIDTMPRDKPKTRSVATATQSQVSGSRKTAMTRATVLQQPLANDNEALQAPLEPQSEYTPSRASSYGAQLRVEVPDRPRGVNGEELDDFKCPYCFVVCHIESHDRWKRHILRDLLPYVCTFQDCTMYEHMFDRRDEWFQHEIQNHRLEWYCGKSGHGRYMDQRLFLTHMQAYHNTAVDTHQINTFLSMFGRPTHAASGVCSLCLREAENIKTHLAHHLEQVALFALPRIHEMPDMDSGANAKGSRGSKSITKSSLDFGSQHPSSDVDLDGDDELQKDASSTMNEPKERANQLGSRTQQFHNALQAAAAKGNPTITRRILDAGANVNAQGGEFGNALQAACGKGHSEIVKLLMEAGADVNIRGGTYGNALQAACYFGNVDNVRLLLESGADVNAQGGSYGNASKAACIKGHIEIVKLLMEAGANINTQSGEFDDALQEACGHGYIEIVKLLIEAGADVNTQGGSYGNSLVAASYNGKIEVVRFLLDKGADIEGTGHYGTALVVASEAGQIEAIRLLLESGADIEGTGPNGTALAVASRDGQIEAVRLLLESGADIEGTGPYGTALVVASRYGRIEAVRLLLERGADIEATGPPGTALVVASRNGHSDIVRLLLESGADIEGMGRDGTALVVASRYGRIEAVRLLLENGADIEGRGASGTALEMAIVNGRHDVEAILREHEATTPQGKKTWRRYSIG